jgi:RNA polymerase sporulation-specific sigma factor
MARPKKRLDEIIETTSKEEKKENREKDIKEFIELVSEVKNNKNKEKADLAFSRIVTMMKSKIMYLSYNMHIPGHRIEDVFQEALFALRYKAIKDYDQKRSLKKDISPFDSFALLCIRRHLSTKLKASYQRKSRALNCSISLDQNRANGGSSDDAIILSEIVPGEDLDEFSKIQDKDTFLRLVKSLWDRMSPLERKVFALYKKGFSYAEITKSLNKGKRKKIKEKSIDNALSRLKQKAVEIYKQFTKEEM